MPLAIFGISNNALNLAVTILVLLLVALWLALIVFTFTDARRRISDPFLVACATAASLFPFIGTLVYTILRPPEFLEDVRERETEIRDSEIRLRHLEYSSCHKCGAPTESDFLRCPSCRTRLKSPCPECSRPVGLEWKVCPYCEHTLVEPRRPSRGTRDRGGASSAARSSAGKPSRGEKSGRSSGQRDGDSDRSRARSAPKRKEPAAVREAPASAAKAKPRTRRTRIKADPGESSGGETKTEESTVVDPGPEPINRGSQS